MQLHLTVTVAATRDPRGKIEIVAEGVVVNGGTRALDVDLVELASPSLALEIVDASGVPLRMPPPPTPGRPEWMRLEPGMRRTVVFRGFMPPTAQPGRYRMRLRYRDAQSGWSEFEVG